LPNINQLASGDYGFRICLWDLRQNKFDEKKLHEDTGGDLKVSEAASKKPKQSKEQKLKKKEILQDYFKDYDLDPNVLEDYTKTPCKILEGHQRAVREIAYSERHKIIVSIGFDFDVYVWNPYLSSYIIKLEGHDQPLVGVNCLPALGQFVTADRKGTVKVWNISDYSA